MALRWDIFSDVCKTEYETDVSKRKGVLDVSQNKSGYRRSSESLWMSESADRPCFARNRGENCMTNDDYANTTLVAFKQNGFPVGSCLNNAPSKIYIEVNNLPPNMYHDWSIVVVSSDIGIPAQEMLRRRIKSNSSGEWAGTAGLLPIGFVGDGSPVYVQLAIRGESGAFISTLRLC